MKSRGRYKRIGLVFLLMLAVLVSSLGWRMYSILRQDRKNQALIDAIRQNSVTGVADLLDGGADVNTISRWKGDSLSRKALWRRMWNGSFTDEERRHPNALTVAAILHHPAIVRLLLDHGADVNARSGDGDTALVEAAGTGDRDMVGWMVDKGADVNLRGTWGRTPLYQAASSGSLQTLEFLLDHGANVNVRTNEGWTTLMRAPLGRRQERYKLVQLLIERGADVNASDRFGETALTHAVQAGNTRAVRLLLAAGADPNVKKKDGQTALMLAHRYPDIVSLLKQAGAKE